MTPLELDMFLRELTEQPESAAPKTLDKDGSTETSIYYYNPETKSDIRPPISGNNTADFITDPGATPPYIKIAKNFRLRSVPSHSHAFIELNYMYSGSCTNTVNGKEYVMKSGDILIMDTNSVHSLGYTGEDDILINMIILPEYAESAFIEMLTGKSVLSSFLVNSLYNTSALPNHIYIKASSNPVLQSALTNLLCEYHDSSAAGANILINCYVRQVFTLLMRDCIEHPEKVHSAYNPSSVASQIITYIKDNCITCTRESTAKHFGYSANHLSKMLSKNTGKGFVDIRNSFRLMQVEKRLKTTTLPVKMVAEDTGFNNATYFYKIYKDYFGRNPRD